MKIIEFKGKIPQIHSTAYISEGVVIVGDVTIGANSNIWFGSVIRGDVAPITIGENTNIQDGTIIHTSRFDGPTSIGSNITVGHKALIHACTIEDKAFIGMGSIIMDHALVESLGFVASGALISPGKIVKSKQLWAGVPAKHIRDLSQEEIDHMLENAEHYVKLAREYM